MVGVDGLDGIIWQYSESASVGGVGNPVDANWGPDNTGIY